MNKTHTHLQAASSAGFCGRNAFVRSLVLACAVACASASVMAQQNVPPPQSPQGNREQPRQERMAPMPQQRQAEPRQYESQRGEPRQHDQRALDSRIEEQRHQSQVQQQEGSRRGGRLTPDERRELRRQINEAGQDLYQNAPRR